MPDTSRLKPFSALIRGYDDTLTSSEREAVISELQKDKERQQQREGAAPAPKSN